MTQSDDRACLEMAYALAEKAVGRSFPNPLVGAVITNAGAIVGWGYHEEAGRPHAEIAALAKAGSRAAGGTLYVTLEPCVHWGRTPPCVDAVIAAGFRRVVVSALDPNPIVHGRGVRRLRAAGLEVAAGLLAERNERLNEAYGKYITTRRPWVSLKAAAGLDGRIAARGGDSRWISSPPAREYVHLQRGEHDAILAGIGTVLTDDPRLTVRHPNWPGKRLARVVLDTRLRCPETARLLRTLADGPILIFTGPDPEPAKVRRLQARGIAVIPVGTGEGGLDLAEVLDELGRREFVHVLVEGGGRVFSSFLEAGLADRLRLIVAPKLIGGSGAPEIYTGAGAERVREALRLKSARSFRLGGDWIVEGYL